MRTALSLIAFAIAAALPLNAAESSCPNNDKACQEKKACTECKDGKKCAECAKKDKCEKQKEGNKADEKQAPKKN